MTTLISKNERESLSIYRATGFPLANGNMLIIGGQKEIEEANEWMIKHGVAGVYFDPANPEVKFSDFMLTDLYSNDTLAITLFN